MSPEEELYDPPREERLVPRAIQAGESPLPSRIGESLPPASPTAPVPTVAHQTITFQRERIEELEEELRVAKARIDILLELDQPSGSPLSDAPRSSIDILQHMLGTIRRQRQLADALAEVSPILFWFAYRVTAKAYADRLDQFQARIEEVLRMENERNKAIADDGGL